MNVDALLTGLVETAAAGGVALLLALSLRIPLRAAFGARAAYAVWGLVPLAMLAVLLPVPVRESLLPAMTLPMPRQLAGAVTVGAAQVPGAGDASAGEDSWPFRLLVLWGMGAVCTGAWFFGQQRRFVAGLGRLAPRQDGTLRAEHAVGCPAVIGAWSPRIVLPVDFESRYSPHARELVLAHERMHLARGDTRINLLVVILRIGYWFNPLLHLAASLFRNDQELACDAAVIARHPNSRRAYAGAMLNTQLAVLGLPVGCHWQSSRTLKERILMLKKPQPGAWRRRAGFAAVAAVLAASSYAAWALQPKSAAPVLYGRVEENGVAIASVRVPEGLELEIRGPSMFGAGDGDGTNVVLDPRVDLVIASKDDSRPWSLRLRGAGTPESPGATWTLTRGGTVEEGRQAIGGDAAVPLDVVLPPDPAGRAPEVMLSRLPADRILLTDRSKGSANGTTELVRDADGVYRWPDPIRAYGDGFTADGGRATLLAHVGADGRVQRVEIEHADPPGSIEADRAEKMLRDDVYTPEYANGRPVPTRIRVSVEFWKHALPRLEPVAAGPAAPKREDSAPAPDYPPQALANGQSGSVLLHLLVATDGSVKEVRVVQSEPEDVFDAVSIEAARRWTLEPRVEDGEPVEGWLQVPITFDPGGDSTGSG
ncbi:TonB family protein [Luteimonas salinilitoris]|uniref:TonB family protein n=1 Tax=Luteimonas salinilitoris TaxID=3237697 RepID=A0ABV4HRR7_9GAMM